MANARSDVGGPPLERAQEQAVDGRLQVGHFGIKKQRAARGLRVAREADEALDGVVEVLLMRLAQLLDEPAVEARGVGLRRLLYQVRERAEHGAVGDGRGLDRHGEAIGGGDELALPREF